MSRLLLMAVTIAAVYPVGVAACSCMGPRNALEARSSGMVVLGRVMRVEYRERAQPANAWDDTPIEVELDVSRSWRGRTPQRTIIGTGLGGGDCGFHFEPGFEYLIPLYRNEVNEWTTGICAGVQPIWEARSVVRAMGLGHGPSIVNPLPVTASNRLGWLRAGIAYSTLAMLSLLAIGWRLHLPRR